MIDYLTTDSFPEIVAKNKQNIQLIFKEFEDGGISYSELVKKVETNSQMIEAHSTAIRNNASATDQNQADINEVVEAGKIISDDLARDIIIPKAKGTIALISDLSIKDITHLTTQAELFDRVEVGGVYKVKYSTGTLIVTCSTKSPSIANLTGFEGIEQSSTSKYIRCIAGAGIGFTVITGNIITNTPTEDDHVTTKKYVDDAIATLVSKFHALK